MQSAPLCALLCVRTYNVSRLQLCSIDTAKVHLSVFYCVYIHTMFLGSNTAASKRQIAQLCVFLRAFTHDTSKLQHRQRHTSDLRTHRHTDADTDTRTYTNYVGLGALVWLARLKYRKDNPHIFKSCLPGFCPWSCIPPRTCISPTLQPRGTRRWCRYKHQSFERKECVVPEHAQQGTLLGRNTSHNIHTGFYIIPILPSRRVYVINKTRFL